jgi:RNA polymerase subunit RPABC4/transcription elongation factor Spt4
MHGLSINVQLVKTQSCKLECFNITPPEENYCPICEYFKKIEKLIED